MIVLHSRIIPIVLGIFGYTYGSMLGVFLCGMLTRSRGSERGNILAMIIGFVFVVILSGLHNKIWELIKKDEHAILWKPDWLPQLEFPWWIAFGTIATFSVAVLFRTPEEQITAAREHIKAAA